MAMLLGFAGAAVLAAAPRPPHFPAIEMGIKGLSSGELLLGELNCTGCHQAAPAVQARIQPKRGPNLDRVADRLRPDFVRAWLLDPLGTTPGTTMPDVLRGLSIHEREAAVEELIHYLWSLSSNRPRAAPAAGPLQLQQGRVLYHQTGCVACHAPYESATTLFGSAVGGPTTVEGARLVLDQLAQTSQPLPDFAAKYLASGLADFLHDPLAIRPAGRMPSLGLTEAEARAIAAYVLTVGPRKSSPTNTTAGLVVRSGLARRGRDRFVVLGCAGCHVSGSPGLDSSRTLNARPLEALDPDAAGGCLAESPSAAAPRYWLNAGQRAALTTALRDPAELVRESTAPERVVQALARFNCYACHARDGQGGPSWSRGEYFNSLSEFDLGDEGRLPPHLDAVGNKLRPGWLGAVLTNAGAVRPYLAVRMPQYGPTNVVPLIADVTAADVTDAAQDAAPPGDNVAGAALVGVGGYSCVTCHSFGPHPSLGISIMDLTQMSRRLNWDWFRRYLLDPASLRPGTRMPAFWPEGEASVTTILGGDTLKQIASIWSYLSLGAEAPPPPGLLEGLERGRGGVR